MEIQSQQIHSQGNCGYCLATESNALFTIGGDARVVKHIFRDKEIESKEVLDLTFEPFCCISSESLKRCYIGCSDNIIRSYKLDSFEFVDVVGKMTQPIKCLAVSNNSKYLAVATLDSRVDVIELEKREVVFSLVGHQGSVEYVVFDPLDKYLSSIGSDGTLRIWNVETTKCVSVKPYINRDYAAKISCSWSKSGDFLAVPFNSQIDLIRRDSWETFRSLHTSFSSPVELVTVSSNDLYVAYVCLGEHSVYSVGAIDSNADKEVNHIDVDSDEFNALFWDTDGRSILLLDKEVRLTKYHNFLPTSLRSGSETIQPSINKTSSIPSASSAPSMSTIPTATATAENEDSEDEPVVIRRIRRDQSSGDVELEDEAPMNLISKTDENMELPSDSSQFYHSMFQSAASEPSQNRCFLAWNEVGSIVKRYEEGISTIEIEFADRHRKRILFSEPGDIVVASLSMAGSVFGGVLEEENGRLTGFVLYRPFNAWTSRASWRITLPGDELPDLVACTDSLAFVYSSREVLRSWSVSGFQQSVLTPCNHMISMVGNSNLLAIVFEDSPPMHHSHNLKLLLYNTEPFCRLFEGCVPLSSRSTLEWIGFSKEGLFATCDSHQQLRILCGLQPHHQTLQYTQMEWVLFMNLRHAMKEKQTANDALPYFWLVALSLKTVKGVLLPGAIKSPPTIPRPFLSVIDAKLPLCGRSGDDFEFENRMLLQSYELAARSLDPNWEFEEKRALQEFDKGLLRQINVEIGSNRLERAEYLCSLLHSVAALKKAGQIGQIAGVSSLVERIGNMIEEREVGMEQKNGLTEQSLEDRIGEAEKNRKRDNNNSRVESQVTPTKRVNASQPSSQSPHKSLVSQLRFAPTPKK